MNPDTLSSQPRAIPHFSAAAQTKQRREEGEFPNALSQFVFTRTYPRWCEEEGRRETLPEAVDRYIDFLRGCRNIPAPVLHEIREAIVSFNALPSMRALWAAGPAAAATL